VLAARRSPVRARYAPLEKPLRGKGFLFCTTYAKGRSYKNCALIHIEGGVDLVTKIVVVYGPMEGMVHDRCRR
jgi:hypothetical protein